MSGYYGTVRNTETGERVEINHSDGFSLHGDKGPFPSRLFRDYGDGRLYEYMPDGKPGDVRWEWVTEPEGDGTWT